jgi:3-hydroxyisobutyrate dehydrogenase
MSTVGFVGLGDMGSRMVPHLLRANHRVIVFDVIRDRLDAMKALGRSPPTARPPPHAMPMW